MLPLHDSYPAAIGSYYRRTKAGLELPRLRTKAQTFQVALFQSPARVFFQICQYGRWPETISYPSAGDMIATLQGYVSVMVNNDVRIDVTIDRAIRLVNNRVKICL